MTLISPLSVPPPQLQVKRERVERDTSTPKRPNNAFLQFCQEQREAAVAHHLNQTGRTPDKKQLTRQFASRWNALSEEEKKVGVLMSTNGLYQDAIGMSYNFPLVFSSPQLFLGMYEVSAFKPLR